MEDSINISKVALQHGMFLKVSYTEPLPNNDERKYPNVSCAAPVHEDLAKAFNDFIPHLALICEQITNEDFIEMIPEEYDATAPTIAEFSEVVPAIKATRSKKKDKGLKVSTEFGDISHLFEDRVNPNDPKLIYKFQLSDVEFKFQSGIESIKLTGQMRLSTYQWIGIGAPWVKINDTYPHVSDLFQLGELLKYETGEYIINHKYAPPVDPELPFGETDRESFGDGTGLTEQELREGGEEQAY
jgi:hypothetical protein